MSSAQVARDLGIGSNVVSRWTREARGDIGKAFPGQGKQPAELADIERLKREIVKLQAEKDIYKNEAYFAMESGWGGTRLLRLRAGRGAGTRWGRTRARKVHRPLKRRLRADIGGWCGGRCSIPRRAIPLGTLFCADFNSWRENHCRGAFGTAITVRVADAARTGAISVGPA